MNNCHNSAQVFRTSWWLDLALLTQGARPARMRFMRGLFMALFIFWFTGSAVAGDITGQMIGCLTATLSKFYGISTLNASH
jgi:hypothetical protein